MVALKKYQVFAIGKGNDTDELGKTYAVSPSKAVEGVMRDVPVFFPVVLTGFVDLCDSEAPGEVHCMFEARSVKTSIGYYWCIRVTEVVIVYP